MFNNKVTLVTGGASGLGLACVERFTKLGSYVVICDLPTSSGERVANTLGESVLFIPTDVTSEPQVQSAVNLIKVKFNKLDYLINCSGVLHSSDTYDFENNAPHNLKDFIKVLMVNTVGTFNVIRLSVGLMADSKADGDNDGTSGVIINVASIAATEGYAKHVAYSASKAAIAGMTLPLARDLAVKGIRVIAIGPGGFDTKMIKHIDKELYSKLILHPKRYGKPEEFAMMAESIIINPYLNGNVIRLDGGMRL